MIVPDSNASQELHWTGFDSKEDAAVPQCGAPDPYVNLPENHAMQPESTATNFIPPVSPQAENTVFDPTLALERAIERLENFRELNETPDQLDDEAGQLAQIQAELAEKTAAQKEAADSGLNTETDTANDLDDDFESEFEKHVYGTDDQEQDLVLGLEAFEGLDSDEATGAHTSPTKGPAQSNTLDLTQPIAVPLYAEEEQGASSKTSLPVYDVRDFLDASKAQPEPIKGAYQVDPYFYDFETAQGAEAGTTEITSYAELSPSSCGLDVPDTTDSSDTTESSETYSEVPSLIEPAKDDQLFVANPGDVIQIDGADGFDHIDLACFDIEHATRDNDSILVDDKQGTKFEIRFRNVDYALFANGVTLDLN